MPRSVGGLETAVDFRRTDPVGNSLTAPVGNKLTGALGNSLTGRVGNYLTESGPDWGIP
jgi:hypothetical protein